MPQYKYSAINKIGKMVKGNINAVNEFDLEVKLQPLGLDLVDFSEVKESTLFRSKTIQSKDLIVICVQLEQLERAGVPLLESISDLRDTSDNYQMKSLMSDIYESINRGNMFSKALAEHPKYFDQVFVGLVAAGERTGNLADVFHHLAEHLKWVEDIRSKIAKASFYPIFLLVLMCIVISVMMLFVIPQLSKFLIAQGFELPVYTKALIATSNFFQNYWSLVFSLPILTFLGIKMGCKISSEFNYQIDNIILKLPTIGETIRKIEMARFCRFFSITYRSGIGILECLEIAQNVVLNAVIKESIVIVHNSVAEGNSLTNSVRGVNQFPPMVVRMIKIGEDSGRIDETLANVNFFYDREVNDSVNAMIGIIQPALTLILGGIMLWVSLSVFGPLYSSFSKMKF